MYEHNPQEAQGAKHLERFNQSSCYRRLAAQCGAGGADCCGGSLIGGFNRDTQSGQMKKIFAILPLLALAACGQDFDLGPVSVGLQTEFYEAEYSSKGGLSVTVIQASGK